MKCSGSTWIPHVALCTLGTYVLFQHITEKDLPHQLGNQLAMWDITLFHHQMVGSTVEGTGHPFHLM